MSTSETGWVLDTSAVLAYLDREPGYSVVEASMGLTVYMSAVNLCEALSTLRQRGFELAPITSTLRSLGLQTEAFVEADARDAAELRPLTSPAGLSLGDRACLALARRLALPVLTADRAWDRLPDLGVDIRLIR